MKKAQIKKSVSALAMAAVIAVSLFGYGCGAKPASTSSDAGVSGDFTGTAKGFGGDVSVTLTLTDGAITGCTAEGKDETQGVGSEAIAKMPGEIAESGSIAVDGVSGATVTSTAIKEAAAAALTAAGLNADDYKIEVKADETKAEDSTVDADVVIVGAGGAGMTAAITAAAEGKSVVIVESQPMVGGNSVRATGGMNAGKTVYQDENEFGESAGVEKTLKTAAEKYADNETITALAKTVSEQWAAYQANPTGYFDSVELMELDTMIGGKGINDPALVETLCENSADAPVSVILRGHLPDQDEEKYYRVLLVDDKGEQLLVRRNHHYKLHIEGALSFGQASFAEALEAAATNNVWISISDEVNEVEDTDYILTVEKTFVVLDESFTENGGSYTLNYTIKGKNDKAITEADAATVSWIDNGVATQTFETKFEVVNGVGQGHIQIHLLRLENNEKLEGTLLVKKGRLQRKIKVITIRKQSFVPAWVGTEIYGNLGNGANKNNRAHVTAMFTIPESCPKELFPMNVYLSVGDLDIRNASGMELPVVREADNDWYSSGEISSVYQGKEPDYKFVYTADGPGVQRVYFENILNQENGYEGTLYIEAEYFETMRRKFKYSTNLVSITVQGLNKYDAVGSGVQDEVIYYRLVPEKRSQRAV